MKWKRPSRHAFHKGTAPTGGRLFPPEYSFEAPRVQSSMLLTRSVRRAEGGRSFITEPACVEGARFVADFSIRINRGHGIVTVRSLGTPRIHARR